MKKKFTLKKSNGTVLVKEFDTSDKKLMEDAKKNGWSEVELNKPKVQPKPKKAVKKTKKSNKK